MHQAAYSTLGDVAVTSPSHTGGRVEYPNFDFKIHKTDTTTKARLATITTPHGDIQTPNFIFCATKAAVKSVTPEQMRAEGTQIMLSNTFHLMVSPGSELIEQMGGLQKFTGWNGPMLTDSGGYQIFSMGHGSVSNEIKGKRGSVINKKVLGDRNVALIRIDEEGAVFRSYADGSIQNLTPERSMEIQRQLGADLVVVFDECTPFNVDKEYTESSMRRSHRWALRSLAAFQQTHKGKQALYGIVQGGVYQDLRDESTDFVNNQDFFGTAIGGSLGATKKGMHEIVTYTRNRVRDDRPVHLLGIGGIRDIFHGVRQGIDTFDCVHATRMGRHGNALVKAAFWEEEPHPNSLTSPTGVDFQLHRRATVHRNRRINSEIDSKMKLAKETTSLLVATTSISTTSNDTTSIAQEDVILDNHSQGEQEGEERAELDERHIEHSNRIGVSLEFAKQINEKLLARETLNKAKQVERKLRARIEQEVLAAESEASVLESSIEYITAKRVEGEMKLRKPREHANMNNFWAKHDPRPIDPTCSCYTCKNFSRAYVHYLFLCGELLGGTLVRERSIFPAFFHCI